MRARLIVSLLFAMSTASHSMISGNWSMWLEGFGHDIYRYPEWILQQKESCYCEAFGAQNNRIICSSSIIKEPSDLTWCVAKQFLLDNMPEFDKAYMPPSVSVDGDSMFDDNIAFTLMADASNSWSSSVPLPVRLAYVLPYASYHESRQNWRPLFFAKFYQLVAGAVSPADAMARLVAPNLFLNWTAHKWEASPRVGGQTDYNIAWSSSTSPPVVDPFSFISYGYGSCTAWATLVTYIARAVGIPARQAGTPCWNSVYQGVDFRGLATANSNVSLCWHAGLHSQGGTVGGGFLNNHNWVEWYDDRVAAEDKWVFQNVPPQSAAPDSPSLCAGWTAAHGCGYNASAPAGQGCDHVAGGPAAAARDHEIFAVTWTAVPAADSSSESRINADGGPVLSVRTLALSNGEPVSPLVWAPAHKNPLGQPLKDIGLRVVNRTKFYRCKV